MALLKCPPSAPCFDQVVPYMKLYTTFVNNFDEALRVLAQAEQRPKVNEGHRTWTNTQYHTIVVAWILSV